MHFSNAAPIESLSILISIKVIDEWAQGNELFFQYIHKAFDWVPHLTLLQHLQELNLKPYTHTS